MLEEESLIDFVSGGGRLSAPDNATPRYRAELMRLMAIFVDSEMAGAAGFADCINLAPGLPERITATRIVLEKFGHADRVLRLMEPFGDRSADLRSRRIDGDMRLNVFHYPIYGWVDAVVMNMLMGRATVVQLTELAAGSYQPLADAFEAILPVETRHAELGEAGLRSALRKGHDPVDAQASLNYWYPRVVETFGRTPSDHFEVHRRYGLRRRNREELLGLWHRSVDPVIAELGLSVPRPAP
jgi:1,2-phenylacetyl-CoA epoxidase catalytic subunit